MSDETVQRILHDLKVISVLQENQRIYRDESGLLNLDNGGTLSAIYRFVMRENRQRNIADIVNVLSDAFAISENCIRKIEGCEKVENRELKIYITKNYALVNKIRDSVELTDIGLKNLKITYTDDTSLSARIDVVRELKNQSIKELETSINSIKKIVDDYTA